MAHIIAGIGIAAAGSVGLIAKKSEGEVGEGLRGLLSGISHLPDKFIRGFQSSFDANLPETGGLSQVSPAADPSTRNGPLVLIMGLVGYISWNEVRAGIAMLFDWLDERDVKRRSRLLKKAKAKTQPPKDETQADLLRRLLASAHLSEKDRLAAETALNNISLKNKFLSGDAPPPSSRAPQSRAPLTLPFLMNSMDMAPGGMALGGIPQQSQQQQQQLVNGGAPAPLPLAWSN